MLGLTQLIDDLEAIDRLMERQAKSSPEFYAVINKAINRGGKRLRPAMMLAVFYYSERPINNRVIEVAASIELIHQASLFHDAVIDDHTGTLDPREAILIGDYLLAAGFELTAGVNAAYGQMLAEAVAQLAAGQARQFSKSYVNIPTNDFYIKTVVNKTATLFSLACRLGAKLGGLSSTDIKIFDRYGRSFGIAFQIIDDILDQDIDPKFVQAAINRAQEYSNVASGTLKDLTNSKTADGLAKLPAHYLNTSLAKSAHLSIS